MRFGLSEEQTLLKDQVNIFLEDISLTKSYLFRCELFSLQQNNLNIHQNIAF